MLLGISRHELDSRIVDWALFYSAMHAFDHIYEDTKRDPLARELELFRSQVEELHAQILIDRLCPRCPRRS